MTTLHRGRKGPRHEAGAFLFTPNVGASMTGAEIVLEDATHFIAMENPDRVAAEISNL